MRFVSMLALLAACGDKATTTDSATTGTTQTTVDTCDPDVDSKFPEDGDTDAYYRTAVRFTLSGEDATATISVADAAGTAVTGTSVSEGVVVTWTGDDLAPNTEYTATLSYACGEDTTTFTTSSTGAPTTVDVTGLVYNLNIAEGTWVQPAGLGPVIASFLGDYELLVSPVSVGAKTITMMGGVAEGGVQNVCAVTIDFPPAGFANPFFQLQTELLPLVVADNVVNITNLELAGAFSPDGTRIQGAVMKGKIDSRPLAEAFGFGTTDDAGCTALAAFQVECEECDNGEGPYCVTINIEDLEALAEDTVLIPITQQDINDNPACAVAPK
jgi:hypothetical protein